jgi:hypothetical protein
MALSGKVET